MENQPKFKEGDIAFLIDDPHRKVQLISKWNKKKDSRVSWKAEDYPNKEREFVVLESELQFPPIS